MKNITTYILPLPLLFCISLHAQVAKAPVPESPKNKELATVNVTAAKVPPAYKVDNVTKREKFYYPKPNFDPANQYDSIFAKSATAGLGRKSETGIVKLMNDNNKAQMVYYNNADAGTILKLTNPDNGKSTYVIVVGKIPDTESNSFLIKLSDMVARQLSIKDYTSVDLIYYIGQ